MNIKFIALLAGLALFASGVASASQSAQFVGRSVCADCHADQLALWSGSHHDLAMQPATGETVLGDFDNASFSHYGVQSSFYRKDGKFMVRTEGAEGKLQDYEIKYTFGADPLQQYLIEFPGGRMQALSLAWDARSKEQGGQRWFHLYPDEKIAHDDELHWTGPSQNWNSMCAECHSTRLEKNYDPLNKTFATSWLEINVSCEACHGPGSEHVGWANHKPGWEKLDANKGLVLSLDERKDIQWKTDPESGSVSRSQPRSGEKEIEMCARCHSRRSPISGDYAHGEPLLDHYLPRLLDEGMYFADGQMDDEVYVYGSFLQSKMFHAGVTCSDCHEPHSLALRAPGNGVCLQCHSAKKYDVKSHHFHKTGSAGASCAECHMPPKTYMVVDPRHDHSMRIPRPDLSVRYGTPNACNNCHTDKDPEWAAEQVKGWYGHVPQGLQTWTGTFVASRNADPRASESLLQLIRDTRTPDIARATALSQVSPYLNAQNLDILTLGLWDEDPAVRAATAGILEQLPVQLRVQLAFQVLEDDVRAVRIEAARSLAAIPAGDLNDKQRRLLEQGIREYINSQLAMAERPEAQANLGGLYGARGEMEKALAAYNTAIDLNQAYVPAYVNLADLYRTQGDERKADTVLRKALKITPESAAVHHALGLSLIRQQRTDEAVEELRQAATLDPAAVRYVYVYAVALNSTGQPEQAVLVLQGAHNAHPNNIEILSALVAFHRDLGNQSAAATYAKKLRAISP